MTYYPDLSELTMVDAGPQVRAIGWLDGNHSFPTGPAPAKFVTKLRELSKKCYESIDALGWGRSPGFHRCHLCHNFTGSANLGVPAGEVLYVAPEMIFHYVDVHEYLPPIGFIEAVLKCPLPGTRKYKTEVAPFRELHKSYQEQRTISSEAEDRAPK